MRIIIAGSRQLQIQTHHIDAVFQQLDWFPSQIISGHAKGPDQAGEAWAVQNELPYLVIPAPWTKLGKRAGYARNEMLANYGDALVAFWDGKSKGTKHMIDLARTKHLLVHIVECPA